MPDLQRPKLSNTTTAIWKTLVLVGLSSFLIACEQVAEVARPVEYDKAGIRFQYPGNWNITEDEEGYGIRYVVIETPGESFFLAQRYDAEDAPDLSSFADDYSRQLIEGIPMGTAEQSSRSTIERMINGELQEGIYERIPVRVMGIRTPYIVEYYRIETAQSVYIMVSFATDEDLEKVSPGFDQIFGSFRVTEEPAQEETPEPENTPEKSRIPERHLRKQADRK